MKIIKLLKHTQKIQEPKEEIVEYFVSLEDGPNKNYDRFLNAELRVTYNEEDIALYPTYDDAETAAFNFQEKLRRLNLKQSQIPQCNVNVIITFPDGSTHTDYKRDIKL